MKCYRLHIILLFVLAEIAGCTKRGPAPAMESFTFHGTIKTCVTGKPVAGLHLTVKGSIPGSGGILGSATQSYDLGTAVTDQNGSFRITPIKHDGITSYSVNMDTVNAEISVVRVITRDSIMISGHTDFDMSGTLAEYGYLRVNYSDVMSPGNTDKLSVSVSSQGTGCGIGLNPTWTSANPLSSPDNMSIFTGNIQHGTILYRVAGNASAEVFYTKTSSHFTDTLHYGMVYCPANDTGYYNFNY